MKRILVIAGWEFIQHLLSRSFWLLTLVAPLVFSAIVLIPAFQYQHSQTQQNQVIGCVAIDDSVGYCQRLAERLLGNPGPNEAAPAIFLEPILPDTTPDIQIDFLERDALRLSLDSLNEAYNKIQERRKYLFNRPESGTKTRLLAESYQELISTREQRDLSEIAFRQLNARLDTLVKKSALHNADSLLRINRIAGYVVIEPEKFSRGEVDFHAKQGLSFLRSKPLEQALQVMLVEERMRQQGVEISKIQELLQPVNIREILLEGNSRLEFNFISNYFAPVVVVIFLLIAIFTASRLLFNTMVAEKYQRTIETLIASTNTFQIIAGKVSGIGLLGLVQILVWMGVTWILMFFDMISPDRFLFLTLENAGIFTFYYFLGYLFFGSILFGIGAFYPDEISARHASQVVTLLMIVPVVFFAYVIFAPNSMLVRLLSFLPMFSPAFMVLRTPLTEVPSLDYYITGSVLLGFIIVGFAVVGKIFRQGSLNFGSQTTFRRLMEVLQSR